MHTAIDFVWEQAVNSGLKKAGTDIAQISISSQVVPTVDTEHWEELLRTHDVTIWNSVPALYQLLLDRLKNPLPSLRHVLMSGDWIPLELPPSSKRLCPNAALLSLGGATEGSIWSIAYPIDQVDPDWRSIPYGLPLANQNLYVLDKDFRHCAPDVPGELHIGGIGVAMEYYSQPEQTARTFVTYPSTGDRLYKTSDLGTISSAGYFEILGRLDNQVKISGQFVNLSTVEGVLESAPGVSIAAVIGITNEMKKTRLHAFVVSKNRSVGFARELREHVALELPIYMVPAKYALLEQMPLTDNGKVDRMALASFDGEFVSFRTAGTAPTSEMEEAVAKVWQQILGATELSTNDNFFDLGGDSLLAVRAAALLQEILGVEIPIQTLIAHQTIASLASVLEGIVRGGELAGRDQGAGVSSVLQGVIPEELASESYLDTSIALVDCGENARLRDDSRVLLTGATGYLGNRLLLELLGQTRAEIY